MVNRYVNVTKYMLNACFYHCIMPLGTCLTLVTLITIYWMDKRKLLRNSSYSREIGPE